MMQLDDLGGLEEPGRLRREPHHEDRADGKVGGDENPDLGVGLVQPAADLGEPVLGEPRGADGDADVVLHAPAEVVHDGLDVGEVHHDIGR